MQYLDDFNMQSTKEMKLVFFLDAIEHVLYAELCTLADTRPQSIWQHPAGGSPRG